MGATKIERVACYIRVSTQEQKLHGISLDAQRDKLAEYASKHNLKIVEWYEDEGVSGRKLIKKRPALQRMLNDAKSGNFDRILFIKLDRFFRSVGEYHECMKIISPVIWTATEEKYDLSTANGRAFVNMKLTIAELEADQTGERIKLVNEYKVKTGQPLTGSYSLSKAFTLDYSSNTKKVIHNPEYEALVYDYLKHFLTHYSKRGAFTYVKERYDLPLTFRNVTSILKDTKLYGRYRDNYDYCEPYITEEEFNKIQDIIATKNVKKTQKKRYYLFTGLIRCPKCNRILGATTSTLKTTKGVKEYHQYRCTNTYTNDTCNFHKNIGEKKIEGYLLNNISRLVNSHITMVAVEDNTKVLNTIDIDKRLKSISSEMKNLTIAFTKGRISESEYDKLYEELETTLKELKTNATPPKQRDLSKYKDLFSGDWISLYEALNDENKQAFWRKYIDSITVDNEGNIIGVNFCD